MPEFAYVVAPMSNFAPERFRLTDFGAYYRRAKGGLTQAIDELAASYPEPNEHCDICRWRRPCDDRRHADDHLSLVAGITKVQRGELSGRGITTMAPLGAIRLPIDWKPDRGSVGSYERVREQARIQTEGRQADRTLFEPLSIEVGFGLTVLPAPSEGDIFFDLEGDPFAGEGGLEYLFGYAFVDDKGTLACCANWSTNKTQERAAFETFIDFVTERRNRYPDLHVYHYAPYEPGALKRLMGRYATREEEVDGLLRSRVLVDLYAVVRHSVRASVESYSIKKLEPLFGFVREVPLSDANLSLSRVQTVLEFGDESITEGDLKAVEGYNRDDCLSTKALRDWLETSRNAAIGRGLSVPRPSSVFDEASEDVSAWQRKVDDLVSRLTRTVPLDPGDRTPEQEGRQLLANILDWHRREPKAA